MTTTMITGQCWKALTDAARRCRVRSFVAVAYVGRNGYRQLPLRPGSRLVVDASEHAVKGGQTSPIELLRWHRARVQIFSYPGLHAKVYVFGRSAYIGSANVSKRSEGQLVEALVKTSESAAVQKARSFVASLCNNRLTETSLKKLARLYPPPPQGMNGTASRQAKTKQWTTGLPLVKVVQLVRGRLSKEEEDWDTKQERAARESSRHIRGNDIDSFTWEGTSNLHIGNKIVQCIKEPNGTTFVSPPATIVRLIRHPRGGRPALWVYLTIPPERRRQDVRRVSRKLGRGGTRLLATNGLVRPYSDGIRLLQVLER